MVERMIVEGRLANAVIDQPGTRCFFRAVYYDVCGRGAICYLLFAICYVLSMCIVFCYLQALPLLIANRAEHVPSTIFIAVTFSLSRLLPDLSCSMSSLSCLLPGLSCIMPSRAEGYVVFAERFERLDDRWGPLHTWDRQIAALCDEVSSSLTRASQYCATDHAIHNNSTEYPSSDRFLFLF